MEGRAEESKLSGGGGQPASCSTPSPLLSKQAASCRLILSDTPRTWLKFLGFLPHRSLISHPILGRAAMVDSPRFSRTTRAADVRRRVVSLSSFGLFHVLRFDHRRLALANSLMWRLYCEMFCG